MKKKTAFILLFFLSMSLKAEVQYFHRGYFDIGTINRLSDGTLIKIPYRMLTYEPTISYDDFIHYLGEQGAKEAGRLRLEGRDYLVKDGDIMNFRFNI